MQFGLKKGVFITYFFLHHAGVNGATMTHWKGIIPPPMVEWLIGTLGPYPCLAWTLGTRGTPQFTPVPLFNSSTNQQSFSLSMKLLCPSTLGACRKWLCTKVSSNRDFQSGVEESATCWCQMADLCFCFVFKYVYCNAFTEIDVNRTRPRYIALEKWIMVPKFVALCWSQLQTTMGDWSDNAFIALAIGLKYSPV